MVRTICSHRIAPQVLVLLLSASASIAQDSNDAITSRDVVISYGTKAEIFELNSAENLIEDAGCTFTTEAAPVPNSRIYIQVEGFQRHGFDTGHEAGAYAAFTCAAKGGKEVTLRIGPGFSPTAANALRMILEEEGCPATVSHDGLFDDTIDVEVDGSFETFEFSSDAGAYALRYCRG